MSKSFSDKELNRLASKLHKAPPRVKETARLIGSGVCRKDISKEMNIKKCSVEGYVCEVFKLLELEQSLGHKARFQATSLVYQRMLAKFLAKAGTEEEKTSNALRYDSVRDRLRAGGVLFTLSNPENIKGVRIVSGWQSDDLISSAVEILRKQGFVEEKWIAFPNKKSICIPSVVMVKREVLGA